MRNRLLTSSDTARLLLIELCGLNGLQIDSEATFPAISAAIQANFIQKGKLRYQIEGMKPEGRNLEILRELGQIDEIGFEGDNWWGVIIPGALLLRVRTRLGWFLKQYETNPTLRTGIEPIIMLGGARPLDPVKENIEALFTQAPELPFAESWRVDGGKLPPKTEAEMIRLVVEQTNLIDVTIVDTPLQPAGEGKTRPPNTADTVREWFRTKKPESGRYLLVSNQPFVTYQELVVQNTLDELADGFDIVGVGAAANLELPLATFLDNLAKQLHEELIFRVDDSELMP